MAIVTIGLAIALALVLLVYRSQLHNNQDQTLQQQVTDRAQLLDAGSSPASLTTTRSDEAFVWIGSPTGTAVSNGGSIVPIDNPVPATVGTATTIELLVEELSSDETERETVQLRVASAATADGRLVVVAGGETEDIGKQTRQLATLFVAALPLLATLVGGVTWAVGGRLLRPVEAMRARASEISGADLGARVPVPDTNDEIQSLGVTLNSMLERLQSHDDALRQFSADASHELKSPVANLQALVDTTIISDAAWPELKSQISGETQRLRDLVENLLYLATHQDGRQPGAQISVSLDDLLFDEAELLAATGRVSVDLAGVEPVVIQGNPSDLARMLRNLIDNAARHAASRVTLATNKSQHGVAVIIADDGPGIPVQDRHRVFERFTRLDAARARDDGGSGLGLSIVQQICHDHDAIITISDSVEGGALVEVRFP